MATSVQLNGLFPPEFKPTERLRIDVGKGKRVLRSFDSKPACRFVVGNDTALADSRARLYPFIGSIDESLEVFVFLAHAVALPQISSRSRRR